jgi:uncharacterized protein (DUF305 family)
MRFKALTLVAALVAIALIASGCGSDDDGTTNASDSASNGNQTDAMFVSGMIPHHQSAIDMAKLGQEKATRKEIKQLSDNIIESQQAEIDQMNTLATELPTATGTMMSEEMSASMMSDVDSLSSAKDFDKEFIDAMIPHHQSAVMMANMVIADGSNPEVMKLAKAIVAAQSKEIAEMQTWRTEWYGSPLPTAESGSSMGSMDHSSP